MTRLFRRLFHALTGRMPGTRQGDGACRCRGDDIYLSFDMPDPALRVQWMKESEDRAAALIAAYDAKRERDQ